MRALRPWTAGLLLFAIALVGVLGIVWATGAAYADSPETNYSVDGETHTADVGNITPVNAPSYALRFLDNETINDSNGITLNEGDDYEWNTTNGSIRWLSSGNYADGETMTVDYTFVGKTPEARTMRSVLTVPVEIVLPSGILVIAAMTVAGLAAGIYRLFGGRSRRGSFSFARR